MPVCGDFQTAITTTTTAAGGSRGWGGRGGRRRRGIKPRIDTIPRPGDERGARRNRRVGAQELRDGDAGEGGDGRAGVAGAGGDDDGAGVGGQACGAKEEEEGGAHLVRAGFGCELI